MTTVHTLLALDPGIRELGVALFRAGQLEDCQVKSLRRPRPGQSRLAVLERVLVRLLDEWQPRHVAITDALPGAHADAAGVAKILGTLDALLAKRNVAVSRIAWDAAKRAVAHDATATKRMVARALCSRYPHLEPRLPTPGGRPERYALRMFSAVATGVAFLSMTEAITP
ncbi:MAG: crossover junction endodeoxyribonuclease RuvC [Candidatus Zixiibacteriota bacterium]